MKKDRKFTAEDLSLRLAGNKSLAAVNPGLNPAARLAPETGSGIVLEAKTGQDSGKRVSRGKKRREMNATEREFAAYLQRQMDEEEIVSFDYEGLTLRWPDGMRYTSDFLVVTAIESGSTDNQGAAVRITLIEVKGAYCWRQDLVKWRAARANWPLFRFEFWQKVDGQWQQTR